MYSLPLLYVTTLGAGGLLLYLLNILNQSKAKYLIAETTSSSDASLKAPPNYSYMSITSVLFKT